MRGRRKLGCHIGILIQKYTHTHNACMHVCTHTNHNTNTAIQTQLEHTSTATIHAPLLLLYPLETVHNNYYTKESYLAVPQQLVSLGRQDLSASWCDAFDLQYPRKSIAEICLQ